MTPEEKVTKFIDTIENKDRLKRLVLAYMNRVREQTASEIRAEFIREQRETRDKILDALGIYLD